MIITSINTVINAISNFFIKLFGIKKHTAVYDSYIIINGIKIEYDCENKCYIITDGNK